MARERTSIPANAGPITRGSGLVNELLASFEDGQAVVVDGESGRRDIFNARTNRRVQMGYRVRCRKTGPMQWTVWLEQKAAVAAGS